MGGGPLKVMEWRKNVCLKKEKVMSVQPVRRLGGRWVEKITKKTQKKLLTFPRLPLGRGVKGGSG